MKSGQVCIPQLQPAVILAKAFAWSGHQKGSDRERIGLLFLRFYCYLHNCLFSLCLNSPLCPCLINLTIRRFFLMFKIKLHVF